MMLNRGAPLGEGQGGGHAGWLLGESGGCRVGAARRGVHRWNAASLDAEQVEGFLEWNQIPSPMGQAPKKYNALARISATHLYAPIRTSAHLYAPIRTMRSAFGCFFEPRPRGLFFSHLNQHESGISISAVSRNTGGIARPRRHQHFPWQHSQGAQGNRTHPRSPCSRREAESTKRSTSPCRRAEESRTWTCRA